jgi:shikimate kinase
MTQPTRILLIGYRGAGKSTVGPLLAARLGWPFLDNDALLEASAGCTIRDIFAREGEAGFRERETAALREVLVREPLVLATGGGIVLREDNRTLLREAGLVVWLTAGVEVIEERLRNDTTTRERRPVLTVGGRAEIEELLRVREPLYRVCADLHFDTSDHTPDEVTAAIVEHLRGK